MKIPQLKRIRPGLIGYTREITGPPGCIKMIMFSFVGVVVSFQIFLILAGLSI